MGGLITWLVMKVRNYKRKRGNLEDILVNNTLLTCKAIIYSENPAISLNEKLKAYKIYRSLNGNGECYLYVKTQLLDGQDPDKYVEQHLEIK